MDMDTDTVAGLLFILVGLSTFARIVLRSSIDIDSIWYIVMGVGFLSLGAIFIFQDQNAVPTSDRNLIFPLVAVLLFAVGMGVYFYTSKSPI
jgi:hypothetical protein